MKYQIISMQQSLRLLVAAVLAGALWIPVTSVGRGGGGIRSAGHASFAGGSASESRSFSGGDGHFNGDANRSFSDGNYSGNVNRSVSGGYGNYHANVNRSVTGPNGTYNSDVNRNLSATGNGYGNYNVNRNVNGWGTANYNHVDVNVHNNGYYGYHGYDDNGNFWGGFAAGAVTTAAIGSVINTLPAYSQPVVVGGVNYDVADGVYYQQGPSGYRVVNPPVGVTVSVLPSDAQQTTVEGAVYYQANGMYYQPVMQNGVTLYRTVRL